MILKPEEGQKLTELLNHLFARNYRYLFENINNEPDLSAVKNSTLSL